MSLRYSKFAGEFYVPGPERPVVQKGKIGAYQFDEDQSLNSIARNRIRNAAEFLLGEYDELLEMGVAPEVARQLLPVNLMTEFYATANLRNWLQFLDLRTADQALYEIRHAANDVQTVLAQQAPVTLDAWERHWG